MDFDKGFQRKIEILKEITSNRKKLLIVLHDNPDPDAVASGFALGYIVKKIFGINFRIVYGGIIGRAENIEMVNELKIPLFKAGETHFHRYSNIAMVDTQPHTGNNSLPDDIVPDIVIDHHPLKGRQNYKLQIIDTTVGANSTILVEFLNFLKIKIPKNIATALAYGISSETQNLGREAYRRDINAYLTVYPESSLKKLSKIIFPKLRPDYYIFLNKALSKGFYHQNIVGSHLGEVPYPELIPEIADLLVRRKGITISFCTGIFKNSMFISIRTTNPRRKIFKLIKKIVGKIGTAGGHNMIGGGKILLEDSPYNNIIDLEYYINRRLLKYLDIKGKINWNPLIPVK
ncbi:phosphoesterase [candidate division KSB1 bacterium]|nr:MAG: phosphoesterase [candidate division KSB1 bacterium]